MPTFEAMAQFLREYRNLTDAQRKAFMVAVVVLRADMARGEGFSPALRVKKMSGHNVWEMTWAADGRATFHCGDPVRDGHQHIVWRRIGTHEIFSRP